MVRRKARVYDLPATNHPAHPCVTRMPITASDVVLFQGDSITDCGRSREAGADGKSVMGEGYAAMAGAKLQQAYPGITVHNRGISGNRVTDLKQRWQADALDLRPTVLSILIGVNDTWHGIAKGTPENGTTVAHYEAVYRQLLTETRQALPRVQLVICQPFTTQSGAVLEFNFHPDIDQRSAVAQKLAGEFDALWVPFHAMFETLSREQPPAAWAADGVHPSPQGHRAMADLWFKVVTGQ